MFLEGRKEELERILKKLDKDIESRDKEINTLEEVLEKKDRRVRDLEKRVELKDNENVKLQKKVVSLEHKVADSQNMHEILHDKSISCENCNYNIKALTEQKQHIRKDHPEGQPCSYNDRGYCKFGRSCQFRHSSQTCESNGYCERPNCNKRHPIPCKFGLECVFGKRCAFDHKVFEDSGNDENEDAKNTQEEGMTYGKKSNTSVEVSKDH